MITIRKHIGLALFVAIILGIAAALYFKSSNDRIWTKKVESLDKYAMRVFGDYRKVNNRQLSSEEKNRILTASKALVDTGLIASEAVDDAELSIKYDVDKQGYLVCFRFVYGMQDDKHTSYFVIFVDQFMQGTLHDFLLY